MTAQCLFSDVTCEPPPEIAGGKIEGVKKSRYLPGESARYQCWRGFQMTGSASVTCRTGNWTELPKCKGTISLSLHTVACQWDCHGAESVAFTSPNFILNTVHKCKISGTLRKRRFPRFLFRWIYQLHDPGGSTGEGPSWKTTPRLRTVAGQV